MSDDHHYDGVGVCIYCDQCNDPACCPAAAGPCDRRNVKQTMKTAEEFLAEQRERGR